MNRLTYLYGFTEDDIKTLLHLTYKEALSYKLLAAQQLAERLKESSTDSVRKLQVNIAIKCNQVFLEELQNEKI